MSDIIAANESEAFMLVTYGAHEALVEIASRHADSDEIAVIATKILVSLLKWEYGGPKKMSYVKAAPVLLSYQRFGVPVMSMTPRDRKAYVQSLVPPRALQCPAGIPLLLCPVLACVLENDCNPDIITDALNAAAACAETTGAETVLMCLPGTYRVLHLEPYRSEFVQAGLRCLRLLTQAFPDHDAWKSDQFFDALTASIPTAPKTQFDSQLRTILVCLRDEFRGDHLGVALAASVSRTAAAFESDPYRALACLNHVRHVFSRASWTDFGAAARAVESFMRAAAHVLRAPSSTFRTEAITYFFSVDGLFLEPFWSEPFLRSSVMTAGMPHLLSAVLCHGTWAQVPGLFRGVRDRMTALVRQDPALVYGQFDCARFDLDWLHHCIASPAAVHLVLNSPHIATALARDPTILAVLCAHANASREMSENLLKAVHALSRDPCGLARLRALSAHEATAIFTSMKAALILPSPRPLTALEAVAGIVKVSPDTFPLDEAATTILACGDHRVNSTHDFALIRRFSAALCHPQAPPCVTAQAKTDLIRFIEDPLPAALSHTVLCFLGALSPLKDLSQILSANPSFYSACITFVGAEPSLARAVAWLCARFASRSAPACEVLRRDGAVSALWQIHKLPQVSVRAKYALLAAIDALTSLQTPTWRAASEVSAPAPMVGRLCVAESQLVTQGALLHVLSTAAPLSCFLFVTDDLVWLVCKDPKARTADRERRFRVSALTAVEACAARKAGGAFPDAFAHRFSVVSCGQDTIELGAPSESVRDAWVSALRKLLH
jgi:hypothetical protein